MVNHRDLYTDQIIAIILLETGCYNDLTFCITMSFKSLEQAYDFNDDLEKISAILICKIVTIFTPKSDNFGSNSVKPSTFVREQL